MGLTVHNQLPDPARPGAGKLRLGLSSAQGWWFVLVVACLAHFSFSWMGFNPTDDGFVLAYSRRLLQGEVPHLDFISIRPVGSPLLHLPFVLVGGDYTFWLSRWFVWCEYASIAWAGVVLIKRLTNLQISTLAQVAGALIIFVFTAFTFLLAAWHSVDGLFLIAIGLMLCTGPDRRLSTLGYLLLGSAILMKQNFILMPFVALLVLGGWRQARNWVAVLLPGLCYGIYLAVFGATGEAVRQLTTQADFYSSGVQTYSESGMFSGILLGASIYLLASENAITRKWPLLRDNRHLFGVFSAGALTLFASLAMTLYGLPLLYENAAFIFFGTSIGVIGVHWAIERKLTNYVKLGLLVVAAAWSASISLGYKTPALGNGLLLAVILAGLFGATREHKVLPGSRMQKYAVIAAICVVLSCFVFARTQHIYREQSAPNLNSPLAQVFPGMSMINTNQNTYAFLADLNSAIKQANTKGKQVAILPDLAAYWVASGYRNPLPIDWVEDHELNTLALRDRVYQSIITRRPDIVVLVQKVAADQLAVGFVPVKDYSSYSQVTEKVRRTLNKVGETTYFELYK